MPIPEVVAVISGIRGAIDIVKGLKSAYDAHSIRQAQSEILEKLLNLQVDALSLQEKTSSLLSEKEELVKKLSEFENWAGIDAQHRLYEIAPSCFVRST